MAARGSRVGLRWCDSEAEGLLEIWADDSIQSQLDTTLGDDIFIILRCDDICMNEQSCPGHGLWEQCDHGPAGGVGRGGIVLNLPPARNRQACLVWVHPQEEFLTPNCQVSQWHWLSPFEQLHLHIYWSNPLYFYVQRERLELPLLFFYTVFFFVTNILFCCYIYY